LLSDEPSYVDRYEQEIRSGGYVVGVPLPDGSRATRDTVRAILRSHGARFVVSSGRFTHLEEE
jgi:hypothetical protein